MPCLAWGQSTIQIQITIEGMAGGSWTLPDSGFQAAMLDSLLGLRQVIADSCAKIRMDLPDVSGLAAQEALEDTAWAIRSAIPDSLRYSRGITVPTPQYLRADTTTLFTHWEPFIFVIDSIWAKSEGSTDDFDFGLLVMDAYGGSAETMADITVSDQGVNCFTAWVTSLQHNEIAPGQSLAYLKSADSTNALSITLKGHKQ